MIRVANFSSGRYLGWYRTTTDARIPKSGTIDGVRYVMGRRIGIVARCIDLWLDLEPGDLHELDPSRAIAGEFEPPPVPNPTDLGVPSIAGVPLAVVSIDRDGAGFSGHFRARTSPMLCVDLWAHYYPGQWWARGTVVVTASNCAVPDMAEVVPHGFILRFGDAACIVPGQPNMSAPLMPEGTVLADGQARSFPVTFVWWSRLFAPSGFSSASAVAHLQIGANGIDRPYGDPYPMLQGGVQPLAWSYRHLPGAIASLHRWEPEPGVGPNMRSSDTGAQADQLFPGAECAGVRGVGAEIVRYLVALSQSRRPCHHLEPDGNLLDLSRHPGLLMWDGRAHDRISRDQLGKPRPLLDTETNGWWGPDVEHWLMGNLCLAYLLTGDPALEWQLQAQARVYLCQWTAAPGLATSSAYAARAIGYEALNNLRLWQLLSPIAWRGAVAGRWHERWIDILVSATERDIWDIRRDDPRLGAGEWWMPWQQAVGAYGVYVSGGHDHGYHAALRVVNDAWTLVGNRWVSIPVAPVGRQGTPDESWNLFAMPLAAAVVLREDPTNARARSIWEQCVADWRAGKGGETCWLPPEVTP